MGIAKKREYDREWRAANKDRIKEYDRNLRPEQKAAHSAAKQARKRKFRVEFVGPSKPREGVPSPFRKTEEEKRVTKNAARRRYYERNKAKFRAKDATREAEKAKRTPWQTEFDQLIIEEAYALLPLRKEATGVEWHVDHMLPLRAKTVSGLHVGNNLAVIPASLNVRKGEKLTLTETGDWLRL